MGDDSDQRALVDVAAASELRRSPRLMGAPAALALVVGFAMVYRIGLPLERRQHAVGIGTVAAIVDTPTSQIVDLSTRSGPDIAALAARASLLASLVAAPPIKDDIAARARVPAQHLIGLAPVQPGPESRRPRPVSGATVGVDDPEAYVLRPSVPFQAAGDNPIIEVRTQAPDATAAARLATAAVAALEAHLASIGTSARVPFERRLVVRQLAPADASTEQRGPPLVVAAVVSLLTFGLGCVAMVRAVALRRRLRAEGPANRVAIRAAPHALGPR